jgi:hypothetical protein
MSNNDPKRESELDDFRRALTQQGVTQAPSAPEPSTLDRFKAAFGDVAERSTSWVSARVHDSLQDFVGPRAVRRNHVAGAERQVPGPRTRQGAGSMSRTIKTAVPRRAVSCVTDPDTPLLRLSPYDYMTLRDAYNGIHITGSIGSGKLQAPARPFGAHFFARVPER